MKKIKTVKKVIIVWVLIATIFTINNNSFLSGRLLAQTGFKNQTLNNNPQRNNSSGGNWRSPHNSHGSSVYIRGPRNPWGSHFGRSNKSDRVQGKTKAVRTSHNP